MTSSFSDLGNVGTGKSNGINGANLAEARRLFTKGEINAAKHRHEMDYMHHFRLASAMHHPWGLQLTDPNKLKPTDISRDTSVPVVGLEGGSTVFIEAGKLMDAGMSKRDILNGVTADEVIKLVSEGELDMELELH